MPCTLPFCCTGEFRAGKYEGHGTETLANGAVYEGDFKAGVREGQGTYTTPSGAVYEGQFKAGLKEGVSDELKRQSILVHAAAGGEPQWYHTSARVRVK